MLYCYKIVFVFQSVSHETLIHEDDNVVPPFDVVHLNNAFGQNHDDTKEDQQSKT